MRCCTGMVHSPERDQVKHVPAKAGIESGLPSDRATNKEMRAGLKKRVSPFKVTSFLPPLAGKHLGGCAAAVLSFYENGTLFQPPFAAAAKNGALVGAAKAGRRRDGDDDRAARLGGGARGRACGVGAARPSADPERAL